MTISTSNRALSERVARCIRKDVLGMKAYHVADASGLVKLDAMESPFAWPGELQSAWLEELSSAELNRYPDPSPEPLMASLRQAFGIDPRHSLMLGNGSDEIIHLLIQAVAAEDALVMAPEPSFVMYRILSEANRVRFAGLPLDSDFQLDPEKTLEAIREQRPSLLFLACPNNPTGNLFDADLLRQMIRACPGLVVIDEAYTAFTEFDALPWLEEFDNLVVMRTLSKIGLAGARLGFLVGHPQWVEEIDKLRLPYNVNSMSECTARFALKHFDVLDQQARLLRFLRGELSAELGRRKGLSPSVSEANFILVRCKEGQAKALFKGIKAAGVLIKCLHGGHPLLADCLRFTVGNREQNDRLLGAVDSALKDL